MRLSIDCHNSHKQMHVVKIANEIKNRYIKIVKSALKSINL